MTKCSNTDCYIVKHCGQICLTLAYDKQLTNMSNIKVERYEPQQDKNGNWFCSQIDN